MAASSEPVCAPARVIRPFAPATASRAALNASGIELPPPPGGTHGDPLHVNFIPLAYVAGFALMTSTLLLASWWPARRAARLDPVEAIAHV